MNSSTNILYIIGAGRSGSTLLGNVLGQVNGLCHIGEFVKLWEFGLPRDERCGCGNRLSACMFWQEVLDRSFGIERPESLEYLRGIRSSLTRTHRITGDLKSAQSGGYKRNGYLRKVLEVYREIHHVSGAAWIIDSSKVPSFAYLLSLTKDINLSILHLVRDPRAVAFSWHRRAINGHRASIWKAPILWTLRNRAAEAFKRYGTVPYYLIRYEDFASHPKLAIDGILSFIQHEADELPFLSEVAVRLDPTHAIGGNPSKHSIGEISIQADVQWVESFSRKDRLWVSVITAPQRGRYGYTKH